MRKLKSSMKAVVDLNMVLVIGMVFAALTVIAYIIWTLVDQLGATGDAANSIGNITTGFDSAISLILVVITIFILALAIAALLMLRARK